MGFVNGKGNILNKITTVEEGSIGANAFIQSKKTYNYVDMDNDMLWLHTISLSDGKTIQKSDSEHAVLTWIPVSAGDVIMTSKTMHRILYYDSNKNLLSNKVEAGNSAYTPYVVPDDGTVFARVTLKAFEFWKMSDNAKEGDNICVYKSTAEYPRGDVRPWIPSVQINGSYISDDFYDTTLPKKESEFNRVMSCKTIKTINRMKGIMRVGSFNTFGVAWKGDEHWLLIKKELMDWGINMCGFQEIYNHKGSDGKSDISFVEYMKNFQFPYGDTIGCSGTGKRLLSDCEVLESTEVVYTNELATGNAYLHNIVKLPNHGNVRNFNKTASVYVAHFTVAYDINHAEVAEICEAIKADTSEYKILIADTNGFGGATEENPYSTTWQMLIEAGMNPAITDTTRPTVTVPDAEFELTDLDCIDNVFFTNNIKCVNWDIIDSNDYLLSNGNPVSDHCMVFADLIFDYMPEFEKV